jgi:hypothetical protein
MTACCASLCISGSDVQLLREELGWVSECFELQCVATWVEKEHGGLFTNQTLKADARFDHKRDTLRFQIGGEHIELVPCKNDAKVGDGYVVGIDRVVVEGWSLRRKVTDDLVAEEIEVNPLRTRPALRATKHAAIKRSGRIEISDRKGEVERLHPHSLTRSLSYVQQ